MTATGASSAGASARPRTRRRRARARRRWYLQPTKLILSAGALAGALGSILALTGNVRSLFADPPDGRVKVLQIQDVLPLTYGEWIVHEGGELEHFPPDQLRVPGQLITYQVDTEGFEKNTTLPVRLMVKPQAKGRLRPIAADSIRVENGNDCGCSEWVPTPDPHAKYRIAIQIFPPGGPKGQPLRQAWTPVVAGA